MAITYTTICEAYTLIRGRLLGRYALEWLAEIGAGALLINPTEGDYDRGVAKLERFRDHAITLVDAVSAAVADRLELPVWTFDRHFKTMGANVWSAPGG